MFVKKKFASFGFFIYLCCMNAEQIIRERYGKNAVPHKRENPFKENDLIVTELDGGLRCRAFSPATPNGLFVVEYYGVEQMYRLSFDFTTNTVQVNQNQYFPPENGSVTGSYSAVVVATYIFFHTPHTLNITFVDGQNLFFNDVRDALKNYYDVQNGYLWVSK